MVENEAKLVHVRQDVADDRALRTSPSIFTYVSPTTSTRCCPSCLLAVIIPACCCRCRSRFSTSHRHRPYTAADISAPPVASRSLPEAHPGVRSHGHLRVRLERLGAGVDAPFEQKLGSGSHNRPVILRERPPIAVIRHWPATRSPLRASQVHAATDINA